MIYLDTPDFSKRVFCTDRHRDLQPLLILYAIKELFVQYGMEEEIQSLEGQYLNNPFHQRK